MRRKTYLLVALVIVVVALAGGLSVARAQGDADLPDLTPRDLMARVAANAAATTTVSGDIAWTNDLLGLGSVPLPGGSEFSSFLKSGSGRFWSDEGKARLEAQGRHGDTTVVYDGKTMWVYSAETDTATEYTLPQHALENDKKPTSAEDANAAKPAFDMAAQIDDLLAGLAPHATLSVTEATVAGRPSYVLVLTPTAANTVFGTLEVAFDGETFLPLRLQVLARGDNDPVLEAGFTTVSYDAIADDVFLFTPPAGTQVEGKTLSLPGGPTGSDGHILPGSPAETWAADWAAGSESNHAPLSLAEAESEAGFTLLTPSDPALPFTTARVLTLPTGGPHDAASTSEPADSGTAVEPNGPVAVLAYGQGFGTVLVVEAPVATGQMAELIAQLDSVPVIGAPVSIGDRQVYRLETRLGSAVMWQEQGLLIIMAGSVPYDDLVSLVAGTR